MGNIGLLGGLSRYSTELYYRYINDIVQDKIGDLESAEIILNSINAKLVWKFLEQNREQDLKTYLLESLKAIEKAKVDFIGICCNSVHYLADFFSDQISTPIINMIDVSVNAIPKLDKNNVAVLSTTFSINKKLYQKVLKRRHYNPIIPDQEDINKVNKIILNICNGIKSSKDQSDLINIISKLENKGAECIILGCTELGILIKQEYFNSVVIDSAFVHSEKLAELYLNNLER